MRSNESAERVRVLVVAGRDPSGAGVGADEAALRDAGVEPLIVVTAETDQDARGVRSIGARAPRAWLREGFTHVLEPIGALKFGLLPGADHVRAACDLARSFVEHRGRVFPIVVDPVIAASSGGRFLDRDGVRALRRELLAQPVIATPNLDELAELAGCERGALDRSLDERLRAARELLAAGAEAVVVKGGHGREDPVRDLVARRDGRSSWVLHPRVAGAKIRGSGCRFASRLAAELARGATLEDAVERAGRELERLLRVSDGRGRANPLP